MIVITRKKHLFVYILCVASELTIDTMMCHDPMERKRQEHIKELIVTEHAYIEDMRLVHEVFPSVFFLKSSLGLGWGYRSVFSFLSSKDSLHQFEVLSHREILSIK